jgi:hypothetical protein
VKSKRNWWTVHLYQQFRITTTSPRTLSRNAQARSPEQKGQQQFPWAEDAQETTASIPVTHLQPSNPLRRANDLPTQSEQNGNARRTSDLGMLPFRNLDLGQTPVFITRPPIKRPSKKLRVSSSETQSARCGYRCFSCVSKQTCHASLMPIARHPPGVSQRVASKIR